MVLLVLELWLRRCGKEWGIAGRDVVFARLKEKLSKGDYEAGGCGRGVCLLYEGSGSDGGGYIE